MNILSKKFEEVILPSIESNDKKVGRAVKQIEGNLGIIVSEGEKLTSLINDVLDLAKIEQDELSGRQNRYQRPML